MKISRRGFLKIMGAAGLGTSMIYAHRPLEIREIRLLMGTYVTVSFMGEDRAKAERAVAEAFREMNRLIRLLSRYDANSQVGILNSAGVLMDPAPELREVLGKALYYSQVTGGAFDATVAPLLDLYRESFSAGRPPTPVEVEERLRLVDYRGVAVDERMIYFRSRHMRITLDGIAKGYIVDKAAEVMERMGISHALIDAGGDIRAVGGKTGASPWSIGIRHPEEKDRLVAYYGLTDKAVATSGGYEVYFDDAKLYTHLINPLTGYSPRHALSVTAVAEECADADAVSTACFVMGLEDGLELMRSLGIQGLIVAEDGSIINVNNGFRVREAEI